jgi:N-acetylneuraminic acid mutarotase
LYNDIWYFDLTKRTWHQISAVGYIPTPRESCAAALVDDTIYIFGGKGLNGSSLGDLCAFRIKSKFSMQPFSTSHY